MTSSYVACTPARRLGRRAFGMMVVAALVGCEGTATFDMATNAPGDPVILRVLVDLEGIELTGDRTQTLLFDDPVRVDLIEYVDGNLFRLFTDETLSDGRYTGVRLLFSSDADDDNEDVVVRADGEFPLTVAAGVAAEVDFTVDKDDASRDDIVLMLDLRQSLSFDDRDDEYTLTPLVRGARVEDTGRLTGLVTASCRVGTSLAQGGAVYLFAGEDQTPDDRDGIGVEPYLTTAVVRDGATGSAAYSLRYISEGDYTIALTCDGDEEDAARNDNLRFQNVANVRVRAEQTVTRNLGG